MGGYDEKKWFVYLTDHHEGPFSLADLQAKMDQHLVSAANYIWAEGMADWKPMTDAPEFALLLNGGSLNGSASLSIESESAAPELAAAPAASFEEAGVAAPVLEISKSIEVSPSFAAEDKTGDLDPADFKRATEQRTLDGEIPIEDRRAAPRLETLQPRKRPKGRLIPWLIIFFIPIGLAAAYLDGELDPLINAPFVKSGIKTASDFALPYLIKLTEKVPALARWVSPLPTIEDVTPEDYDILKATATQKLADGPKIAIAISTADIFAPSFYVASNLPDGAVIEVYVGGVPETLLNRLSYSGMARATITHRIGKTGPLRSSDGKPLARGDYIIYATESERQPDAVKAVLAGIPPVNAKFATLLPRGLKLLVSKTAFLGGAKDATYVSRLKEFHDRLRTKASQELMEIKQFEGVLESQLSQFTAKYNQLRGQVRKGHPTPTARKSWKKFNTQWIKLDQQLNQSYAKWTDQALRDEYFYGTLYAMSKTAGDALDKLYQLHADFFAGKKDLKTLEIERGSATSVAGSALNALKAKIAQAENLAPTPNGMPRREGL